ncbi:MAG: FecR domain-containing protein [Arcobacteraceae bacterium]|nr:FecR domain-containing protein [Arcobacteraceae bacterium]
MKKIFLLLLLFTISLFANIGEISAFSGDVNINRNTQSLKATVGFILKEKDIVKTSDNSKAQVVFEDGTVISIGKNAILDITEFVNDTTNPSNSKTDLRVLEGAFKTITGGIGKVAPDRFKLKTKSASIGIRGTIIYGNQSMIACTQGEIEVKVGDESHILPAGMMTKIEDGSLGDPEPIEDDDLGDIEIDISDGSEPNDDNTPPQDNQDEGSQQEGTEEGEEDIEIEPLPTQDDSQDSLPKSPTPTPTQDNPANTEDLSQNINDDTTKNTFQEVVNNQEEEEEPVVPPVVPPVLPSDYTLNGYIANYRYDPILSSAVKDFNNDSTVTITPIEFDANDKISASLYSSYVDNEEDFLYDISTTSYSNSSLISFYYDDTYDTKITIDNKGEFVTLLRNYDNMQTYETVQTLGYYGKSPTISALETNKIYTYTSFAEFYLPEYGSGDLYFGDSLNQTIYLNSTNKSIFLDNDTYITQYDVNIPHNVTYGSEFTLLKLNANGTLSGSRYYTNGFGEGYLRESNGTISGSLYGSELQGLGFTSIGTNTHNFSDDGTYNQINSAYLDTITATTNTGTLEMNGYLSGFGNFYEISQFMGGYMTNGSTIIIDELFSFSIDKSSGVITADNELGYTTQNGHIDNLTMGTSGSYYIDQDKFGSLFDSYDVYLPVGGSDDVYNLDTGWFFSIPDSYDSSSNTLSYNLDDDTSWGYWTATLFKDGSNTDYIYNVNNMSTWVAGIETASSAIPTTGSADFSGHILGSVQDNAINNAIVPILMNSTNSISANIDFGSGAMTGSISFEDAAGFSWSGTLSGGHDAGMFNGAITGTVSNPDLSFTAPLDNSVYSGNIYGENEIKAIGGNFSMQDSDGIITANGVFKATGGLTLP